MTRDAADKSRIWRGPVLAWALLFLLFAINLGSAYLPMGAGNLVMSLFIAAVMTIVLAVFLMDLRNSQTLVRVVAVAGLFWSIIMFALTFSDYLARD